MSARSFATVQPYPSARSPTRRRSVPFPEATRQPAGGAPCLVGSGVVKGTGLGLERRLLFRSGIWEIARPRTPLTEGHVLIRLSDPATPFESASASDWLFCHTIARHALSEVLGSTRCALMFAHRWHPLGAAIGEPAAESSTPTFHLFGRWDGEPTTPGGQLGLPAHRRVAAGPLVELDIRMRGALRRAAQSSSRSGAPLELLPAPFPRVRSGVPVHPAGVRHTVLAFEPAVASIGDLSPSAVLALGAAVERLPSGSGISGFSCVASEGGSAGLELHVLGRSAAEAANPLERLLGSSEVSLALL